MDIAVDLTDIWGNAIIYIWDKIQNKYHQIVTYDVNICQYLQRLKPDKTNLLNAWILNFFKFGNLTRACPIKKVVNI